MQDWDALQEAGQLTRRGEAFALATVVWRQGPSSGQQGARAIITAAGELRGWIGGACAEPAVIREARAVIAEGVPKLLLLGPPAAFPGAAQASGETGGVGVPEGMTFVPISCQSEGALEVYVEPVLPAPHLVIVGRSPMAHTLADLARALGWRAALLDGPEFSAADADESAMVVVATQGHGDEAAIEQAVAARPAYLGLVGSAKRGAAVLGYLADRGVPQDQLDRVHVPAGLDLGRTSHREIAVAILAELVQLRAAGQLPPGTAHATPGQGRPAAATGTAAGSTDLAAGMSHGEFRSGKEDSQPERAGRGGPAEAVDPVCGMTVVAGRSSFPLEYQGVTYYFCCAGCRQAFESDPAAYLKESRC
jgi:xanthine dehydrogenase accessory factor